MEKEIKYKNGPWFIFVHADKSGVEIGPRYNKPHRGLENHVDDVCRFRSLGNAPGPEQMANAYLISAAPELFEALKEAMLIVSMADRDDPYPKEECQRVFNQCHAAIAKAEGRS